MLVLVGALVQAREFGTGHSHLHTACKKPLGERGWCYLTAPQWGLANDLERDWRIWDRFMWLLVSGGRAGRVSRETCFVLADPCGVAIVQGTRSLALQATNILLSSQIERTVSCWHKDGMAFCEGTSEDRSPLPTRRLRPRCRNLELGPNAQTQVEKKVALTVRTQWETGGRPSCLIGQRGSGPAHAPPPASVDWMVGRRSTQDIWGLLTAPTKAEKTGPKRRREKTANMLDLHNHRLLAFASFQTPERPC